ncbi:MAG: tRNA guanosine(34) transglycosylase Tgt [Candidatus Atribacteria bacterium]|nr:tRNA guanosine(34) transglycosylase Tgt [Candidatus Atribacteria bacterium]
MKSFTLIHQDEQSKARVGILHTSHGDIPTPVFMPVGTQGTVKAMAPDRLKAVGVKMVLGNSYHLHLRPGEDLIREMGGLHRFMSWDGSILTDSGGFQIFSLSDLVKIDDQGALFRSHLDGSLHCFTPETSMQIQQDIGADVVMVLDQCVGYPASDYHVKMGTDRTLVWAQKCREAFQSDSQMLFGIVQGGTLPELRKYSAEETVRIGFDGYAIGGLSVGEPKPIMYAMIDEVEPYLPKSHARYLMGVGTPDSIIEGVRRGIDMFDCVLPTRNARNSALLTWSGRMNIDRLEYSRDSNPIDPQCQCYTCQNFSRSYLRHLFKAGEILAAELATIHNLFFMVELMNRIRKAILNGSFQDLSSDLFACFQGQIVNT